MKMGQHLLNRKDLVELSIKRFFCQNVHLMLSTRAEIVFGVKYPFSISVTYAKCEMTF